MKREAQPTDRTPVADESSARHDSLVGRQLRQVRQSRQLSLQQVAERAGLSIGLISQIERGQTTPSIRSLRCICEALKLPMGWLFHNGEPPPPEDDGVLVRPAMRRSLNLPAKGITKQLLTPDLTGSLQMLLITVAPGGSSGEDRYSHAGEECGYLLRGQLRLWAGSGEYLLNPGDSFRFQSTLPHRFANPSDSDAEVVWVTTPPFY